MSIVTIGPVTKRGDSSAELQELHRGGLLPRLPPRAQITQQAPTVRCFCNLGDMELSCLTSIFIVLSAKYPNQLSSKSRNYLCYSNKPYTELFFALNTGLSLPPCAAVFVLSDWPQRHRPTLNAGHGTAADMQESWSSYCSVTEGRKGTVTSQRCKHTGSPH